MTKDLMYIGNRDGEPSQCVHVALVLSMYLSPTCFTILYIYINVRLS